MANESKRIRDEFYEYYWQKFENSGLILPTKSTSSAYGKFVTAPAIGVPKWLGIVATISLLSKSYEARGCVEILIEYPPSKAYKLGPYDYNRDAFHKLHDEKPEITNELNLDVEIDWMEWGLNPQLKKPNAKPRARISCFKYFNSKEESDWHEHYPWFIETIAKFDDVFTPRLKNMNIPQ